MPVWVVRIAVLFAAVTTACEPLQAEGTKTINQIEWKTSIENGKFPVPNMVGGGYEVIQLHSGRYEKTDPSYMEVTVSDVVTGFLDGEPAAVADVWWNYGGTGVFGVLTLYRSRNGHIEPVGQFDLEDRADVHGLKIAGNTVVMDWNKHGPSDPASRPTRHEVVRLHSRDFESIKD